MDKELRERFERLKGTTEKADLPSDDELLSRLRNLTGRDPVVSAKQTPVHHVNTSTTHRFEFSDAVQSLSLSDLEKDVAELLQDAKLLEDIDTSIYEDERIDVPRTPIPGVVEDTGTEDLSKKFIDYTTLVLTSPSKTNKRFELGQSDDNNNELGEDDAIKSLLAQVKEEVALEKRFGDAGKTGNVDFKPSHVLGAPPRPPSISDFREDEDVWCCK
ncbi:hypothetical protein HK102_000862 [Quaeritorhiza haematococci]|nr:hypothetical protein HK102_000862 [Quaeritorhiza haematococci]